MRNDHALPDSYPEGTTPFRVLTIDGGGMRGLYSAKVLQVLSRRFNATYVSQAPDVGGAFDLICGTSTGSILACGLAAGVPLETLCELYIKHGTEIFPCPMPSETETFRMLMFRLKSLYRWGFHHRKKPSGNAAGLKAALEESFEAETLAEVYRRRGIALCIPAVDASSHRAVVFKTPHDPLKHRDGLKTMVNACMASSAAPIFLPLACSPDPEDKLRRVCHADGGLWANNPVMIGLIEALHLVKKSRPIEILSLGTCSMPTGDPSVLERGDRGLIAWKAGIGIVEMSMSAQASGQSSSAELLAQVLSEVGLSVSVIRLEEEAKSPQEYSAIGLDKADERATQTLMTLADRDANIIHSRCLRNSTPNHIALADIFGSIRPLETSLAEEICDEQHV